MNLCNLVGAASHPPPPAADKQRGRRSVWLVARKMSQPDTSFPHPRHLSATGWSIENISLASFSRVLTRECVDREFNRDAPLPLHSSLFHGQIITQAGLGLEWDFRSLKVQISLTVDRFPASVMSKMVAKFVKKFQSWQCILKVARQNTENGNAA